MNVSRTTFIWKVKAGCACEVMPKTLMGPMQVRMLLSLVWVCISRDWGEGGEKWSVPNGLRSYHVHGLSATGTCDSLAHSDQ